MGTLRTIFAISVVLSHVWPGGPVFVGGKNAVQLFYVISGFLISFVLTEKKTYANIHSFYVSRYLRLYPIYAAIAFVALCTRGSDFFDIYRFASTGADALLAISNVSLFGQDWVMFAAVKNNSLAFATNFWNSDVVLWRGLLVPQAWSLGVELTFYVIAPFVLPRRQVIYFLLIASLVSRAYLIWIGLGTADPWSYRFFPNELALFLLGALSHQILLPFFRELLPRLNKLPEIATSLLVGISLTYDRIAVPEIYKEMALLAAFALLIPLAFTFQQRYRLDTKIGELSYPIYICHILVIDCMRYMIIGKIWLLDFHFAISAMSVFVSVAFAVVLNKFIADPLERLRNRFKMNNTLQRSLERIPIAVA